MTLASDGPFATDPARRVETIVLAFGPAAAFEGRVLGALERAESGGALRVLGALVVTRDAQTGEVLAMRHRGGSGGMVAAVTDFRLNPARRLPHAVTPASDDDAIRELGEALEPGAVVVAVSVEHAWFGGLVDAVARTGGHVVGQSATVPADLGAYALSALRHGPAERQGP